MKQNYKAKHFSFVIYGAKILSKKVSVKCWWNWHQQQLVDWQRPSFPGPCLFQLNIKYTKRTNGVWGLFFFLYQIVEGKKNGKINVFLKTKLALKLYFLFQIWKLEKIAALRSGQSVSPFFDYCIFFLSARLLIESLWAIWKVITLTDWFN